MHPLVFQRVLFTSSQLWDKTERTCPAQTEKHTCAVIPWLHSHALAEGLPDRRHLGPCNGHTVACGTCEQFSLTSVAAAAVTARRVSRTSLHSENSQWCHLSSLPHEKSRI